jgi:hypothetical protein
MEKQRITPEESFDIITKAISNFKTNYKEHAQIFLLWGWTMTLAGLSHFIVLKILLVNEAYNVMGLFSFVNWGLFTLVGFIIHFFMLRKIDRNKKVYSYLDSFYTRLWQATAISFFVAVFLCVKLEIAPPAIMLLIAGLATTASGLIIKFRPLILGGLAFFVFSIASTFVSIEYTTLISSAALFCCYVIPGYFLKYAKD